jgi:uncharacterized protein (DUF1778 family)
MATKKKPRKRTYIKVFTDIETKNLLKDKAKTQANCSLSRFLLDAGLNKTIKVISPDVRQHISRWSQNLNQIAIKFNVGIGKTDDIQDLKNTAMKLLYEIRKG